MNRVALIDKFIQNRCSAAEASEAFKILQDDAELLDLVLNETEWDAINPNKTHNEAIKAGIWQGIAKETKPAQTFKIPKVIYWAASIIMVLGIGLFIKLKEISPSYKTSSTVQTTVKHNTLTNTSNSRQYYHLPDGSEVTLHPKSQIKYTEDFKSRRNVHLTGKAVFKVAKDSLHPFIVHSGTISTTALGTKFLVDYSSSKINIQLFEGKVLVKSNLLNTKIKEVILTPGEQCFVDMESSQIIIDKINIKTAASIAHSYPTNKVKATTSLTFYKNSLTEIFSQLENDYKTTIKYLDTDIHDKYFTGTFTKDEPLENILQTITKLNELEIKVNSKDIIIFKNQAVTKPAEEITESNSEDYLYSDDQVFFNQAPLKLLFKTIENRYQTKVIFEPQDIENKFFTGEIYPDHDVSKFLLLITKMNGLELSETSNGFKVNTKTKSQ